MYIYREREIDRERERQRDVHKFWAGWEFRWNVLPTARGAFDEWRGFNVEFDQRHLTTRRV